MRYFFILASIALANSIPFGHAGRIGENDALDRNIISGDYMWTDNTVYYQIDKELEGYKDDIESAMRIYENQTENCVKFVNSKGPQYYLRIVNGTVCKADVGLKKGAQWMRVGPQCHNTGTYLHLLGNVLGLLDEFKRPDRDQDVKILWENVNPNQKYMLNRIVPSSMHSITPFDKDSIMMSGSYVYSRNGKPTMLLHSGEELESLDKKTNLTESDIKEVRYMYKCGVEVQPRDSFCDFESSKCFISIMREATGTATIVKESGNSFLRLKSNNTKYVNKITMNMGSFNPYTEIMCMSFKYRVIGADLSGNIMRFYDGYNNLNPDEYELEQFQTGDWIEFKGDIPTLKNNYDIFWNVLSPKGTEFIVDMDDFRISHKNCE